MDIAIPNDKMGEFFFLDSDEEEAKYGARGDYKTAAVLAKKLLENKKSEQPGVKYRQVMDFKVRVLDFIAIYVK
jgi:hypothetical protein